MKVEGPIPFVCILIVSLFSPLQSQPITTKKLHTSSFYKHSFASTRNLLPSASPTITYPMDDRKVNPIPTTTLLRNDQLSYPTISPRHDPTDLNTNGNNPTFNPTAIPINVLTTNLTFTPNNVLTSISNYPSFHPTIYPKNEKIHQTSIEYINSPTAPSKFSNSKATLSSRYLITNNPSAIPNNYPMSDATLTPSIYSLFNVNSPSINDGRPPLKNYVLEARMILTHLEEMNDASIIEWQEITADFLSEQIVKRFGEKKLMINISVITRLTWQNNNQSHSRNLRASRFSQKFRNRDDFDKTTGTVMGERALHYNPLEIAFSIQLTFRSFHDKHNVTFYVKDSFSDNEVQYIWFLRDTNDPIFLGLESVTVTVRVSNQSFPFDNENIKQKNTNDYDNNFSFCFRSSFWLDFVDF